MPSIVVMTTASSLPPQADHAEKLIRDFIAEEGAAMSPETAERYAVVADSLFEFLENVDVRPRLGPEIARYLDAERERLGAGAFLPTLGVTSMLRMIPEFLVEPWLPPIGAQRRTHRAIVDRLLVFLRRRELVDPTASLRDDFARARRAVAAARIRDYRRQTDSRDELIRVTVELSSRVLDPLLADVENGDRRSLSDAVEQQLEHRHYFPQTFRQLNAR